MEQLQEVERFIQEGDVEALDLFIDQLNQINRF